MARKADHRPSCARKITPIPQGWDGWEPMTARQQEQAIQWEFFRREAILDGLSLDEASEYATLMTT